jgi:hypothetical protein
VGRQDLGLVHDQDALHFLGLNETHFKTASTSFSRSVIAARSWG